MAKRSTWLSGLAVVLVLASSVRSQQQVPGGLAGHYSPPDRTPTTGAKNTLVSSGWFGVGDPVVSHVSFQGARHVKESRLRDLVGVHTGDAVNVSLYEQGCARIEAMYKKTGYPLARCLLVEAGCSGSVVFEISEGPHASALKRIPGVEEVDRSMRQTVVAAKTAPFSPPQLTGARPPSRIGRILLAGNEQISTESVLAHVPLVPGQILTARDVQQAEELLAQLGLFVVDPLTGIRPTVTVLDSDGDGTFKDILIKVQEKPATEPTAARSH